MKKTQIAILATLIRTTAEGRVYAASSQLLLLLLAKPSDIFALNAAFFGDHGIVVRSDVVFVVPFLVCSWICHSVLAQCSVEHDSIASSL